MHSEGYGSCPLCVYVCVCVCVCVCVFIVFYHHTHVDPKYRYQQIHRKAEKPFKILFFAKNASFRSYCIISFTSAYKQYKYHTVAVKKTFPKLVHHSLFERPFIVHILHRFHIVHIVHICRSLYPVIRMLFTNDCRSCFPVQKLYKCICSLHMYMYMYMGV